MKAFLSLPFIQVAVPIIIAFAFAAIAQSKRLEAMGKLVEQLSGRIEEMRADVNQRLEKMDYELAKIDDKLDDHSVRLKQLQARRP